MKSSRLFHNSLTRINDEVYWQVVIIWHNTQLGVLREQLLSNVKVFLYGVMSLVIMTEVLMYTYLTQILCLDIIHN